MKEIARKLGALAKKIATEKGSFKLFALVLPEDTITWDLLVAAEWINANSIDTLNYLVKEVQRVLTEKELLQLSSIIPLEYEYSNSSTGMIESETGWEENDIDFFGVPAKKAYVFVAPVGFHIESNLR